MSDAKVNTDKEIWREREGDYYADSIHVTPDGRIGMSCGGMVITKPIREWFKAALQPKQVDVEALKQMALTEFMKGREHNKDLREIAFEIISETFNVLKMKGHLTAQPEWLPIDSAPKDGTSVLLRYYKGKRSDWRTIAQDDFFVTEGFYYKTNSEYGRDTWEDYAGRVLHTIGATTSKNQITHWMPLPTPPKQEGE